MRFPGATGKTRNRGAKASAGLAAGVLAAFLCLLGPARPALGLDAVLASQSLSPGGVAICRVRGLVPTGMTLAGFSQEAGFYFSQASREWVALLAVPLAARPGRRALELSWPGGGQELWVQVQPDPFPRARHLRVAGLQRRLKRSALSSDGSLLKHREAGSVGDPLWHGRFLCPLRGDVLVTSPFGVRRVYNRGQASWRHMGVDLRAAKGTPVVAANDGVVVLAKKGMALTGGTVVIDHGYQLVSAYFHLGSVGVKAGEKVSKGGILGRSGSTGLSQGPHLHFEMRLRGIPVNPWQWVQVPDKGTVLSADSSGKTAPGPI